MASDTASPPPSTSPSRADRLATVLAHTSPSPTKPKRQRKVSQLDRLWVQQFERQDFKEPELAAAKVGFKTPGAGYKLELRLRDLIEEARRTAKARAQMELDEALILAAEGARDTSDRKVQVSFLTLILRAHGALSDKPPSTSDRRDLAKQVALIIEKVQKRGGSSVRLRAAMQTIDGKTGRQTSAQVEVESGGNGQPDDSPIIDALPPPPNPTP